LTYQTIQARFNARPFVEDRNDNADAFEPERLSGFNAHAAGTSDETQDDANTEEELQRG
jgi:hypothetical protein